MKPLKVGVVGLGVMGMRHARLYTEHPGVELVGGVDTDLARRKHAATEFNIPTYSNCSDLIPFVDAVSIASPASYHAEHTFAFLEHGIHVLVEKPMVIRLSDAQRLVDLARQKQVVLQVGYVLRFYPVLRELNLAGAVHIEMRRLSRNPRIQDIGVVLDLLTHDLDLITWRLGEYPRDWAITGFRKGPHEEDVCASLYFSSGLEVVLRASRIAEQPERSIHIQFADNQFLHLDFQDGVTTYLHTAKDPIPYGIANGNPLKRELTYFIDTIQSNSLTNYNLTHDLQVMQIALALQDSLL